jgi:hypothetical protein
MTAELRSLAPGRYRVQLSSDGRPLGTTTPPLEVERGHYPQVKFELPPQKLCVLTIAPSQE